MQVRAFVAIDLDPRVKATLRPRIETLASAPGFQAGRWVSPESMHVTLQFLGPIEASESRVGEIKAAMDRACASIRSFRLVLSAPGFFPDATTPRVAWLGLRDCDDLLRIQRTLQTELSGIGFLAKEEREFRPHLTLLRVRDTARAAEVQELVGLVSALRVDAEMTVREVSLFRTDAAPDGSIYTSLATTALDSPE